MATEILTNEQILLLSFAGGVLPALLWLWFWLKEDARDPEPRTLIVLAFLGGMITALAVIPIEKNLFLLSAKILGMGGTDYTAAFAAHPSLMALFAGTEELFKYFAVALIALSSRYFDEPVDALVYLITVALGFAAMENSLYLLDTITESGLLFGILNGHLRFIGATLLHVASSALIGIALGLVFYRSLATRFWAGLVGLAAATALHTGFNFSIIQAQSVGDALGVFAIFWAIIVGIILVFEKVKRIYPVEPIS